MSPRNHEVEFQEPMNPAHEPVRARTHARIPRIHDFDPMTGHSRGQES